MGPERLGELIDRWGGGLTLFARQWSDAPEDAVQEAFVALAALGAEPNDPRAWLFRAVRNAAINSGIADRRRRRREAIVGNRAVPWFEPPGAAGPVGTVEPEAAEAALRLLPDPEREVIVAHLWGGLTFAQVADLVGTSASSAHRIYQAGLARLRDHLGAPPCRPTTPKDAP